MTPNTGAIAQYLSKDHPKSCARWKFSGDRHCSCGLEAARAELHSLEARLERAEAGQTINGVGVKGLQETVRGWLVFWRKSIPEQAAKDLESIFGLAAPQGSEATE